MKAGQNKKLIYSAIVAIVVVILAVVIAVYSLVAGSVIEKQTLGSIEELAEHDKNTITMFVNYSVENLKRVGKRLNTKVNEITTQTDVNSFLTTEALLTTFDKIYLLNADGSYYTDNTLYERDSQNFFDFKILFDEENKRTIAYSEVPSIGGGNVIIYGYKVAEIDGFEYKHLDKMEGGDISLREKELYAIIGINSRDSLERGLVIGSFTDKNGNSRGYSAVIDKNGNYIVNINKTASVASDNWFNVISECDKSDLTAAQVDQKMKSGEAFAFYNTKNGRRTLNYCVPFGNNIGWHFLLTVEDGALSEQTVPFILMMVVSLGIIVSIIITGAFIIMLLRHRTTKALAQEKAQSEFLSNMSHEIRTPLNGLVGLNYLIMTSIDDPSKKEQIKEWLSKSHSTANYLLSLINDVLDVSKLQAGKVEIIHEPLLIEPLIDAISSMQHDNITSRGIEFILDVNITEPCIVGDEIHLKQILMNIVGNAAKFTPAGGFIKLSAYQDKADGNRVATTIVCEDSGCGMSEEFMEKIFDVFTQDRSSVASSTKGTGLGMAISKLLVDAMGGNISVESKLGKGSKFTVTIPAEISDVPEYIKLNMGDAAQQGVGEDGEVTPENSTGKPLKILVAEDNELNAEILLEILGESGFEVKHAHDGGEAVKMFEESEVNEFGVILMDMRMPVLDGCEASRTIRALPRPDAATVPIFACTANSFKEDRINAFESGMNDFLTKPIDVKVLLQKMKCLNISINANGIQE